MLAAAVVFAIVLLAHPSQGQQVETNPLFLDSFLPAGMQIIAHATEAMKYDLRPTTTPTTTRAPPTSRPTAPHKPAVFAPVTPPTKFRYADLEKYLDREAVAILRLANEPEVEGNALNDGDQSVFEAAERFLAKYDEVGESLLRQVLVKAKQRPPTRAYVSLLSLYDLLNKEAKKMGLNKYNGYASRVLEELVEASSGTSAYQMGFVLEMISKRGDTKNALVLKKIDELVRDLKEATSYISAALRDIPPLKFTL